MEAQGPDPWGVADPGPPVRLAVVGARRRRQGLGAWLARFAQEGGADLRAIAGTSEATVAEAAGPLAGTVRGYVDVEHLLDDEDLDAAIVASPWATHEEILVGCLERGLHVLCEKPLVWGVGDPAGRGTALAEAFVARGLHLVVLAQWPFSLSAYERLHPGVLDRPPERFSMELAPAVRGPEMWPEALPHALRMLAAVRPDPAAVLRDIDVRPVGTGWHFAFTHVVADRPPLRADVSLVHGPRPPRPFAYAFDGHEARRHIEMPSYRQHFVDGDRAVEVPDPARAAVVDFLRRVTDGEAPGLDPAAVPGMAHLAELVRAGHRATSIAEPRS